MSLDIDKIIKLYFQQNNILIKHHIDSYNNYVDNILPNIISENFPIILLYNDSNIKIRKIIINIKNFKIKKPLSIENNGCSNIMTPTIARLKNCSYLSSIFIDFIINIFIEENGNLIELKSKIVENILLGKIPIMVKSKYCIMNTVNNNNNECKYDIGGYFIINGNEKIIISQEKIINNIIQVYKNMKANNKFSYICEIRSLNHNNFSIPKVSSIKITNKDNKYNNKIYISLPHMKTEIPIMILFRALGCETDHDIIQYIIDNDKINIERYEIILVIF